MRSGLKLPASAAAVAVHQVVVARCLLPVLVVLVAGVELSSLARSRLLRLALRYRSLSARVALVEWL